MRQTALQNAADTPALRAKLLMQTANFSGFDPAGRAQAITPLLLALPTDAAYAISADLDKLLSHDEPGLRSAALALKVRAGASLEQLATLDPAALIAAIDALSTDEVASNVPMDLMDLVEQGKVPTHAALLQVIRLSNDKDALFKRLTSIIDQVKDTDYVQWGGGHLLAIHALHAMHRVPDEQWPTDYENYRQARAEPTVMAMGKHIYLEEETGCVRCHGEHGEGTLGVPPLAGSLWLLGSPLRTAEIVKHGLEGDLIQMIDPATGEEFNSRMEPMKHLSPGQMAAALTYARNSWGNFASPVTVDHIAAARGHGDASALAWNAAALLAKYPFKRDRVMGALPAPQLQIMGWSAPSAGMLYMLAVVTLMMGAILLATYLGAKPISSGSHATPTMA